jgi:ribosomal protein S18 acetylase RimI-like enzyme
MTRYLQIDPTVAKDTEPILEISRQTRVFDDEELATIQELLNEYFSQGAQKSGYYFLSCRKDQLVTGFACYGPRALTQGTFDLFWIATAPTTARQGTGQALLARVAQDVKAMQGRLIIAETSGRPDYAPARNFYEKHNYQRAATVADFYAPGDDLVMYVYRL